jgi:hypothetical protein
MNLTPMSPAAHAALAMRIASRAVICDIETEAVAVQIDGQRFYDVRPMLDPREHDSVCIDMAAEALSYALDAGLVEQHPATPHLVRINRR